MTELAGTTVRLRSDDGRRPALDLHAELVRPDGTVAPLDETLAGAVTVTPRGAGCHDVVVTVENATAAAVEGAVRVRLEMAHVDDPWWLVPGAFYGENRPLDCERLYPRFAVGHRDPRSMVSDHWEMRADRAASPAVFGWGAGAGMALVGEELSPLGMVGLGLRHDDDAKTASVHLTFPYREDPITYDGSETPRPADVRTWTWQPGDRTTLHARAYVLGEDRHGYAPVLRELRDGFAAHAPVEPWVSVEEAAGIAAHGLYRWHYDPDPGVLLETVGFDRGVRGGDGAPVDRQAMHVGWVSGIPWAFALLAHARRVRGTRAAGDDAAVDDSAAQALAAESVIDLICSERAPCGTFWGRWERETGWSQSWSPVAGALHARTLGEATLFLLRALALGDDVGGPSRPTWVTAARANLDAMAARQREDGNLGAMHHAATGEVLSWSGASALIWIAALCEAEPLDADGRYLVVAERAGHYYARFVEQEFIHGAPEDVDLAPSSEDGYAAVMAYVALHRRTGKPRWLELARRAADWMLTFRYTYNVTFEALTTLGVYDFATRGADQASPPNQHLHAYGLVCTQEMVELSRACGDDHYAERALEHLACFRQLVPRTDGELNAYRGMITERYYQTSCFQPKGMLLTLSHAWSVGVLLLGCEQVIALGLADAPATDPPDS
ncbi:hypothetical protein GCM10023169_21410 [Georgenia halophila]|uniref:Glucoamylase (Glucan-1,4-alpha-glucosidase), GH15 family n=2 Tax=Georgenia halophila TaxID=620889 RepID=A0ABP8L846_9MICO